MLNKVVVYNTHNCIYPKLNVKCTEIVYLQGDTQVRETLQIAIQHL